MELDGIIFGGGVAGLWLLDALVERGYRVLLLEAGRLGAGQTVASQGIIHGGLKYTLEGLFTASAERIRDMPAVWRDCLAGRGRPDLSPVRVQADACHLWRSTDLRSRFGLLGASFGLRIKPVKITRAERPPALRNCPGEVLRLDEQAIDPVSLVDHLARRHRASILRIDFPGGVEFATSGPATVSAVRLRGAGHSQAIELRPRFVVFTAGEGNAALRQCVGLSVDSMQRRPLHMVLVRGGLPALHGHCTDAAVTRATITSATDSAGRTVWQVGGQIAEQGVHKTESELVPHARRELETILPSVIFSGLEWAAYRVNRAEAATPGGKRPSDAQSIREGNVITAWPTKLALAPRLAEQVCELVESPSCLEPLSAEWLEDWPRPETALPPWETVSAWTKGH